MEINKIKKCPFNCKDCMEEDCRLYDDENEMCEFEDISRFIGECFGSLIKAVKNDD